MSKDATFIEIRDLEAQLSGISPKLAIYKELSKKVFDLKALVLEGSFLSYHTHKSLSGMSLTGSKLHFKEVFHYAHSKPRKCASPLCPKLVGPTNVKCRKHRYIG